MRLAKSRGHTDALMNRIDEQNWLYNSPSKPKEEGGEQRRNDINPIFLW